MLTRQDNGYDPLESDQITVIDREVIKESDRVMYHREEILHVRAEYNGVPAQERIEYRKQYYTGDDKRVAHCELGRPDDVLKAMSRLIGAFETAQPRDHNHQQDG